MHWALERAPVGDDAQRLEWRQGLADLVGARPDQEFIPWDLSVKGKAANVRLGIITRELRLAGLPLWQQPRFATPGASLSTSYDLWAALMRVLKYSNASSPVPPPDLLPDLSYNQIQDYFLRADGNPGPVFSHMPDPMAYFLADRYHSAHLGEPDADIDEDDHVAESVLLRLYYEDPLRLHIYSGVHFIRSMFETEQDDFRANYISRILFAGLTKMIFHDAAGKSYESIGDGRVIRIIEGLMRFYPEAFKAQHVPDLIDLIDKFPYLLDCLGSLHYRHDLLRDIIYYSFTENAYGQVSSAARKARQVLKRRNNKEGFRETMSILQSRIKSKPDDLRAYAQVLFLLGPNTHKSYFFHWSVVGQHLYCDGRIVFLDRLSIGELADLLVYSSFNARNGIYARVIDEITRRHPTYILEIAKIFSRLSHEGHRSLRHLALVLSSNFSDNYPPEEFL
ncbi:MAG: hypothetical protein H7A33_02310 [Deltaproteobacteria bacterium]|nr:hypothetical protein [Deltaproteobacteria bacterium]